MKCEICGRRCDTAKGLRLHYIIFHSEDVITCSVCGKRCKNYYSFNIHVYRMLGGGDEAHERYIWALTWRQFKAIKKYNYACGGVINNVSRSVGRGV